MKGKNIIVGIIIAPLIIMLIILLIPFILIYNKIVNYNRKKEVQNIDNTELLKAQLSGFQTHKY